jgi:hypothetical protein
VDNLRTFDALNRARHLVYGRSTEDPPKWIESAWEVMGMDARELEEAKQLAGADGNTRMDAPFKEFISRYSHFEEFGSPVYADHHTANDPALSSLLYKTF